MRIADIDPAVLRKQVGEPVFTRGRVYAEQGRVQILHRGSALLEAEVLGTHTYWVEVETAPRGISGSCSCPFAEEGHFCKHMVAAVLVWAEEAAAADHGSDATGGDDAEDERLRDFLTRQDPQWLAERLFDASSRDPLLRAGLLVAAGASPDHAFEESALRSTLVDAFRVRDFVHYREAWDYASRIESALNEVEALIDDGFASSAVRLSLFALDLLEDNGGLVDDSDGGLSLALEHIERIHLRASTHADPDPQSLAQMLVERAVASDYEVFYEAAADYADLLGPEGLQHYRDLVDERWHALAPLSLDDYDSRRFVVGHLRERVAEVIGGADLLVHVLAESASTAYDHLRIAGVLRADGRDEEALEWIHRGLAADGPDARLNALAASIHRSAGRIERAGELLWANFCAQPGLASFQALKEGTGEQFEQWREQAIAVLRSPEVTGGPRRPDHTSLVAVLLWDGDLESAWSAAHEGGCREDLWLQLARGRAQEHPEDAIPIMLREADRRIGGAKRAAYRDAAQLLAETRPLYERLDRSDDFTEHIHGRRARHRNRPALQDEFTKARLP